MTKYSQSFIEFSIAEMANNGDKVREWANRSANPLLQTLAKETIEAAGAQT